MHRRSCISIARSLFFFEGAVPEELNILAGLIASQAVGCRCCQAHKANFNPNETAAAECVELARHFEEGESFEIVGTIALFGYLNRRNYTMATDLEERAASVE